MQQLKSMKSRTFAANWKQTNNEKKKQQRRRRNNNEKEKENSFSFVRFKIEGLQQLNLLGCLREMENWLKIYIFLYIVYPASPAIAPPSVRIAAHISSNLIAQIESRLYRALWLLANLGSGTAVRYPPPSTHSLSYSRSRTIENSRSRR